LGRDWIRLIFYTTKSDNGKMTMQDYITKILEVAVKPWLEAGDDFVLEEDCETSSEGVYDRVPDSRRSGVGAEVGHVIV
jgi:hypothetical protein